MQANAGSAAARLLLAALLVFCLDAAAGAEPPAPHLSPESSDVAPRIPPQRVESPPKLFERIPFSRRALARCQAPVADLSCYCLADGGMRRCDTASTVVPAE